MAEKEPTVERWTFGGSRIGKGDKRLHAWIGPDGTPMHFKASGSFTVGSVYDVKVTRKDDGVTMHGNPVYSGRSSNEHLRDELSARHRAAETTIGVLARERADKRDDPTENAIARLVELAANVPPSQRAAFAAYVSYRIAKFW